MPNFYPPPYSQNSLFVFLPRNFFGTFFSFSSTSDFTKKKVQAQISNEFFFFLICKKFLFFLRPQFFAFRFPLLEFCKPERISFFRLSAIQKNKEKTHQILYTIYSFCIFFFSVFCHKVLVEKKSFPDRLIKEGGFSLNPKCVESFYRDLRE